MNNLPSYRIFPKLADPAYTSRLFQDLTCGREVVAEQPLTPEQLRLAAYHGLIGVLSHAEDPKLSHPAVYRYLAISGRQELMRNHLKRILGSLHHSGIPASVLKGPYVAEDYARPEVRTFSDLDLLIPEQWLEDALGVLSEDPAIKEIPPKKPRADKRDIPLRDPSGLVFNLDLHWDLFSYTQLLGGADGATAWAWSRAIEDPSHRLGPLWHLPTDARIAFLSTHAVLDHRFRLILFRDLAEIVRNGVDSPALMEFAKRWQLQSFTYLALLIARDIAGARLPDGLLEQLRPHSMAMTAVEKLVDRADLVHFVGPKPHPLNLAIVLLHDSRAGRLRLALRAPAAAPPWLRRVTSVDQVAHSHADLAQRVPSRILHVLPTDVARGAQTYAKAMRDKLDSTDSLHRIVTIFRGPSAALEADADLGVSHAVGRRLGFSPTALTRLRREVRRWGPQVVVAHGGEALKYAALAVRSPIKLVYYKIGTSGELLRNPVRRLFHRWLTNRVHLVAGVSQEMVEEARSLLGARPDRTAYIPNGRDPDAFELQAKPTQVNPVRFLFVGHITRTKRPELFIDVIVGLGARGVDARGVMAGDGPLLDDLRMQAPERIDLLGPRNDVPLLLANADILLFTSTTEGEGMPGVLIEAGLAGLPVITTDVPGARTVVEDGITGLVVPLDEFEALVEACERLAKSPELRRSMGAAARKKCLSEFTLDSSVDLWRSHLEALTLDVAH